ncbi:MAG TPA: amino acid adenylation domain-containing protein [Nodularia sp. (in: cyanobacteria)]|nr:amino acid adenylation domain-containing protein [Nodularia sp. (in: cyanobacteria)]
MVKDINQRIAALSPKQKALLEKRLQQQKSQNNLTIAHRKVTDTLSLSLTQEKFWLLQQLRPDLTAYNESNMLLLQGQLNINVLEKSLKKITKRHEILRTSFQSINEELVQIIAPDLKIDLPIINLTGFSKPEQNAKVQQLVLDYYSKPFNLAKLPLFKIIIIQLQAEEYILFLNIHHIIFDGWSSGIFYQELAALYQAFCKGESSPLPALPIQYADFALWQKQSLQNKSHLLNYWKQQLKNAPPILNLPTDYPRPVQQSFQGARATVIIPQTLTDALKSLSKQEGVTLFIVLLAAFKTLLYRYTGETDLLIGTPVANRTHSEIENLLGCFVNTLVLRTDVSGELSFQKLVKRVRETALAAYAHQEIPFEQLVKELQPERASSHTPLFQVMFVFQESPILALQLPNLTLAPLMIDNGTAKFDLTLYVEDTKQELRGFLEYNSELFQADTVNRMLGHLQTLLEGIVANPLQHLGELPLLTTGERYQLLKQWNNTQVDYPQEQCIHQLFEEQVEKNPDAVAVVFENHQLTYRELNTKANQLAHYLQRLGVKSEALVGIYVERSLDMIIAILAVLKVGGAYIPLDPAFPQQRLALMLEDSQTSVLLTQQHLLPNFSAHNAQTICLDRDWENIATQETNNPKINIQPDNLIYTIYTSGSTGKPKGVQITHSNVVNFLTAMHQELHLNYSDSLLSVTTLSFDIAGLEIFLPLIIGAKLILVSREVAMDGIQLLKQLNNTSTTVMQATPATWRILLDAGWQGKSQLKLLCGGEALTQTLADQLFSKCEQIWNLYGPTETTIWSTINQIKDPKQTITIGRPLANTQIYILDKSLQPLPVGVAGEIYIGGAGVARGYFNQPELTKEKFISNPFSQEPGAKLYKTGDLARYLVNGEIEYLGRIDYQVKLRGFRIELAEIEAVIGEYPSVYATVVVLREDAPGNKTLVAYLTLQPEHSLTIAELRHFLETKLPNYMIPSAFVILATLPLTPNGKIDRASLPAPDHTQLIQSSIFVAASTPIEHQLAEIWMEVLGINKVGIHDNFFELGGHSLLATRVISRIQQVFKVEIPLRRLFAEPTIAELAQAIETATKAGLLLEIPPINSTSRMENFPLSFAQQRLWFLTQLQPNSPFYNIFAAIRLQGKLNLAALEQSFNQILHRHETLRTNFQTVDGQPLVIISPEKSLLIPVIDISALPTTQKEANVREHIQTEAQKSFDLKTDILLRVKLLRLGEEEYVVLFTMHHIVSDGWSIAILIRELGELYQAISKDQAPSLSELPIQYADFAAWQRQWLTTEVLESQLNYWLHQLAGAPTLLELPTDNPRPATQSFKGASHSFQLSAELSLGLKKLTQQQGSTLFMTLLAAFKTLLYRYTNSTDIVVGSAIANRHHKQIEGLIGLFVNNLVLRSDLSGNPSFIELLAQVREVALGAYAHQDLPFERLVEKLQPERNLSHTPLFQVMFVLQNAQDSQLELADLTVTHLETTNNTAKFDLTLDMKETVTGLVGEIHYNTDLFVVDTIGRMVEHLRILLNGIVANPQAKLSELPLLNANELHQQLVEWNDTYANYPLENCLHQLFETQVNQTPDAVAVVFENQQLTYKELNQKANQLANYLQKLGVVADTLVGICVERSLEMVIGLLGILKAGGAYVPLDPTYPQERLAFMLEDSQTAILLSQQHLVQNLPPHKAEVICLDSDWEKIADQSSKNLTCNLNPHNLAYVIYTSGSTGQPKGAMNTHQGICNRLLWMQEQYQLTKSDRVLQKTPFSFDVSVWEFFWTLLTGACLVVAKPEGHRDSRYLVKLIKQQQITTVHFVPSMLQIFLNEEEIDECQHLKWVICSGEALSFELQSKFFTRCQNIELHNLYGPTEAAIDVTFWHCQPHDQQRIVPIGRPIANTQIYILNQQLQPVAIGVPGELHIGGIGLARGYLNRPQLTNEKFIANHFSNQSGAKLYKTGDLARYLPNGEIEYLGRIDDQVKIRGFRIELGEIAAVIEQFTDIKQSVVIVREDESQNQRLVAYIVANSNLESQFSQLRKFLQQKLPDYMIPSTFIVIDSLPLTHNGKLDRRALPAPEITLKPNHQHLLPRNPIEEKLVAIWAEILNLKQISIDDNFFELGGHSLLATQVISKIRQTLQIELSLSRLFEMPTIATLAEEISQELEQKQEKSIIAPQRLSREARRVKLSSLKADSSNSQS